MLRLFARAGEAPLNPQSDEAALLDSLSDAVLTTDASNTVTYANRAAQQCFEYSWDEFIGMPSRLSAEPGPRAERQGFMAAVLTQGYVSGYRGLRVAKSGRRFWIEETTVWNLIDAESVPVGQAALIRNWTFA